ncbi:ABC transporter permease [Litorilinea aerophila]|uniref:ABC transporter permease n=1 Tax=Litorilinea aerophila TaxID=1204385 RepID=A0A540VBR2_9CHLR|nr:ABC transporter permease [Litorilinea aerophila]MCC9077942.1 ABC transporter permease [Litorilinea aerophila]
MNTRYLIQRLLLTVVVLLGVTFAVFLIIHLVPGDPARVILGVQANEENVAALRERLGLNRPFLVQYGSWLWHALQGDLGRSLITGQAVLPQILQRLPATLQLAAAALFIGMLIGLPAGIVSALRPGSRLDVITSLFSQVGVSIPDFWLGILLVILFSLTLGWLPPSGYTPISVDFGDWLAHLVLPALTAGVISGSIQTRFVRSAMLEVLNEDYIRTARAKGLGERVVILRHGLRNALITIVTILGLQLTALFSAVVVVEVVFAWPGLGRLALDAVLDRDYPLLQGTVLTMAVVLALVNLAVDLIYFFLDPRIEYA